MHVTCMCLISIHYIKCQYTTYRTIADCIQCGLSTAFSITFRLTAKSKLQDIPVFLTFWLPSASKRPFPDSVDQGHTALNVQ